MKYYDSTLPLTGPPAPATLPGRAPDFSFQNEEVLLVPELVAELVWLVRSGIAAGTQLDYSWHSAAAGHVSYPALTRCGCLREYSTCLASLFTVLLGSQYVVLSGFNFCCSQFCLIVIFNRPPALVN